MKSRLFAYIIANCFFLCSLAQPCVLVDIETTPILTLPECEQGDGIISFVNTTGGTPPYQYQLGTDRSQFGTFTNLSTGIYDVAIQDARGCIDSFQVRLLYTEIDRIIKPPNAFTPNGDGFNDQWIIRGIESFQGTEVRVFNRWGQLVHQNSTYSNEFPWDGTQNGSNAPSGTYFYVISIFNNCVEEYLNGYVTIIR